MATSRRTSAGTMSPAARRMISPGTSNLRGTSASAPPRTTVAVLLTMALSFCGRVVGAEFLEEAQHHAQHDHDENDDRRPQIAGQEREHAQRRRAG